jgi:thermitase
MLYPISFIAALSLLILWFSYKNKESNARLFSKLFFLSLGVYGVNLFLQDATFGYKLMALSRDLMIMGGAAFFASILLKKKQFLVVFLAIIGVLIGKFYFATMINTFPEQLKTSSSNKPDIIQEDPSTKETNESIVFDDSWELLVDLKEGSKISDLEAILKKYDLTDFELAFTMEDKAVTDLADYYVINIPDNHSQDFQKILIDLDKSENVDYVEGNEVINIAPMRPEPLPKINRKFGINDPALTHLWGFETMEVDKLYNYVNTNNITPNKKAKIAILDTGIDGKHEDLKDRFFSTKPEYDMDVVGHGTHCAGIASAVTNNAIGVASFAPNNRFVEVTSIKVLNDFGGGTQRTVINGILEAADLEVDVISMSLGGRSNSSRLKAYKDAIKYANKKGAIVIVAAGNSNTNAKQYSPANTPGVITVSAIDTILNRASFSNYIQDIEMGIAAPGVKIYSTTPTNSRTGKYAAFNGTSMATPYVAGLVGLMRSLNPKLDTKEVYSILKQTGKSTKDTKKTGKLIYPVEAIRKVVE